MLSYLILYLISTSFVVDLCEDTKYYGDGKGAFQFKSSGVGYRYYVRCPYSLDDPILLLSPAYASMDCVLVQDYNGDITVDWDNFNDSSCPYSPFVVLTNRLSKEMVLFRKKSALYI